MDRIKISKWEVVLGAPYIVHLNCSRDMMSPHLPYTLPLTEQDRDLKQ